MRKNDKFPFAMTKKSLVVYIVFTVLMGLFLFFVIGDMAGKCAACIVCPMLIAYLLYAYCKESKADTKAREMKAQYMNGSYFESPEWHEKYVAYLNEHTFEKPKYQSMKLDLLKRFQRREYLVKMILPLFLMFCTLCLIPLGRYYMAIIGFCLFGFLFWLEFSLYIGMPVRKWLKGDIDYEELEASYLKSQMAELFQRDKSTISRHIKKIFEEGELQRNSVVANFATTAADGKIYNVDHYNLDVIISVGYRVKSHRGTQFRIWAMGILKEYMKKGFALDDDRLKRLGGGNYFDELLARIRDIRSSEKVFWRKVLEIYATSIDYDPHAEASVQFFKQVQNKMHWAAHKHTAAEVIYQRADAEKENMGLTSWSGDTIHRSDVEVAKNYLSEAELDALNKIVTAYLDIAEVHALNQEPMYMKDWLETIDDYLKMTRRDILTTSGHVSHKQAIEKAHACLMSSV